MGWRTMRQLGSDKAGFSGARGRSTGSMSRTIEPLFECDVTIDGTFQMQAKIQNRSSRAKQLYEWANQQ